jgi:hypothetical protein
MFHHGRAALTSEQSNHGTRNPLADCSNGRSFELGMDAGKQGGQHVLAGHGADDTGGGEHPYLEGGTANRPGSHSILSAAG